MHYKWKVGVACIFQHWSVSHFSSQGPKFGKTQRTVLVKVLLTLLARTLGSHELRCLYILITCRCSQRPFRRTQAGSLNRLCIWELVNSSCVHQIMRSSSEAVVERKSQYGKVHLLKSSLCYRPYICIIPLKATWSHCITGNQSEYMPSANLTTLSVNNTKTEVFDKD